MTETAAHSNSNGSETILSIVHKTPTTLLDCPTSFSGSYGNDVERFLNYIEAYKNVKRISDEQALAELPHLLHASAYTWWTTRQDELKSWSEVVLKLRHHFNQIRPAHIVYADIFKRQEDLAESWVEYLNLKVELFAQLPHPQPTDPMQLDMIYGLLSSKLREKFQRNELESIAHLVARVKEITQNTKYQEQNQREETSGLTQTNTTNDQTPEHTQNAPNMERINNEAQSEVNAKHDDVKKYRSALEMMPQVKENDLIRQVAEYVDGNIMNQINDFIDGFEYSDVNESSPDTIATVATIPTIQPNAISARAITAPLAELAVNSDVPVGANVSVQTEKIISVDRKRRGQVVSQKIRKLAKMTPNLTAGSNHQAAKTITSLTATVPTITSTTSATAKTTTTTSATAKTITTTLATSKTITTTSATSKTTTTTTSAISTITPVTKQQSTPIVSSASESHKAMTTKLISAPCLAKYIQSAKFKLESQPKCHQCGTVGYYRSICPNCSPIYFYKPHGSANR